MEGKILRALVLSKRLKRLGLGKNSEYERGMITKQRNFKVLAYKLFHVHGDIGVLTQHMTCRT